MSLPRALLLILSSLLSGCREDTPKPDPAPGSGDGLFLGGCPQAGRAAARVLEQAAERPWGEEALAMPGDVLLVSSRAAFVIQGIDAPRTYYHYGGTPIDAVAVEGCDQAGPERLEEMGFVVGQLDLLDFNDSVLRQIRATEIAVVEDGSGGGAAVVEVRATDDRFWLVEDTLIRNIYEGGGAKPLAPLWGLDILIRYTLDPDAAALQMEVELLGASSAGESWFEDGFLVGVLSFPSDLTPVHAWSTGTLAVGGFGLVLGVPWLAAGSDAGATAIAMPGATMARAEVSGVTALLDVDQAGAPLEVTGTIPAPPVPLLLGVGATDAASAGAALEPYLSAQFPVGWGDIRGEVRDTGGAAVAGATVEVYGEAEPGVWRLLDRLVSGADGGFSGRTLATEGGWQVRAVKEGRAEGATVAAAPGAAVAADIGERGWARVEARDGDGWVLPVRAEFERTDGRVEVRAIVPGQPVELPVGRWQVWLSRGYEHALATAEVEIAAGDDPAAAAVISASMPRIVNTAGWASMDTHVHSSASADSSMLDAARMATVGASGLDLVVSTDHEAIVDLEPARAASGMGRWFQYGLGSEVTATLPEHVNAWPFPAVASDPRGAPVRWYGLGFGALYDAIRDRGATVIQLNHSRVNGSCGILCLLDWDRLSAEPGATVAAEDLGMEAGLPIWSWDFDSFEVMNGLRSPYLNPADPRRSGALEDWLAFHNLGHRVAGVGVTDVHGTELPGSPRTYVKVDDDDPDGGFTAQDMAAGVLGGATVISAGAFADASIGGAGPGGTAAVSGGVATLSLRVEALPEIDVQAVTVLLNCDAIDELHADDPDGTVKLDQLVEIPVAVDSYVVLVGQGVGDMPRGLEGYSPVDTPRFITGPIFIDADGDGVWTAPGPKRCDTALYAE